MADPMVDLTKMTELMEMSRIGTRGMTMNPADLTENLTTCPSGISYAYSAQSSQYVVEIKVYQRLFSSV
jgi:hypothetical protein